MNAQLENILSAHFPNYEQQTKVDQIISAYAQALIDQFGYDQLIDDLNILDKSEGRFTYNKQFSAKEWIGAHLTSVLRDKVYPLALKEGHCPECGGEIRTRYIPGTNDEPPEHWIECKGCRMEFDSGDMEGK